MPRHRLCMSYRAPNMFSSVPPTTDGDQVSACAATTAISSSLPPPASSMGALADVAARWRMLSTSSVTDNGLSLPLGPPKWSSTILLSSKSPTLSKRPSVPATTMSPRWRRTVTKSKGSSADMSSSSELSCRGKLARCSIGEERYTRLSVVCTVPPWNLGNVCVGLKTRMPQSPRFNMENTSWCSCPMSTVQPPCNPSRSNSS
mmetsp:Transcript_132776/g.297078  ORF Transcript_132776/g.297078 Transcript_132776/m.297078 type:complete len:203 (+) Transcript_132776:137-745(+)